MRFLSFRRHRPDCPVSAPMTRNAKRKAEDPAPGDEIARRIAAECLLSAQHIIKQESPDGDNPTAITAPHVAGAAADDTVSEAQSETSEVNAGKHVLNHGAFKACMHVIAEYKRKDDIYKLASKELVQHASTSAAAASATQEALRSGDISEAKSRPLIERVARPLRREHAVAAASGISSESALRRTLTVFVKALPPEVRQSLPKVLLEVQAKTSTQVRNNG
ncbi:hypothetical protein BAUCODRAFT_333518 [Baudoinia panamericana UAMH 10762]|uniref:Uncharacterized protein n=1 Tax=Baudoinia panamericana (strain UAMH 10762) TaxID=717646 RepID=M2MX42_BAUPA|nr:uncharacterized protein BAUCODRAFT_333518 [Baudoinia panamericana UAMH 10762]EMC90820.1 hypothetical protein BAUCODRAFT_333518 [Baudoinia panamericana UAMH 10762]